MCSGILLVGNMHLLIVHRCGWAVALLIDDFGWGSEAEELVHLLEGHALCLGDEEPCEQELHCLC